MIGRCALSILRSSIVLPASIIRTRGNVAWLSQRKDMQKGAHSVGNINDGKMEFKESRVEQGLQEDGKVEQRGSQTQIS
jgi:hypothetical protein